MSETHRDTTASPESISLDQIRIASPCPMKWERMRGDGRVRHCRHCDLNVYNLSAMTRAEATDLVTAHEGRLCAMYWRRADGTVITSDCPVGGAAVRRKRARVLTAAGALLALGVGAVGSWTLGEARRDSTRVRLSRVEPFGTIRGWFVKPGATTTTTLNWGPGGTTCILGKVGPSINPTTGVGAPASDAEATEQENER